MTLVRMLARPMLSSMFLVGGVNALKNSDQLAVRAKPVIDRLQPLAERLTGGVPVNLDAKNMVRLGAAVDIVGGAMLATGRSPRLASLMLAVSLVPTTLGGHRYWEESDPQQRATQRIHFFKNISMTGGLLLASLDTEGRPSLGWQAKRQARIAKKRASELLPG